MTEGCLIQGVAKAVSTVLYNVAFHFIHRLMRG